MAKNKLKGQKSRNVFHIASQRTFKAKNKAKPVTTNLKKINIMNDEKVNRMNTAFVNIQKELANFSKSLSLKSVQKELENLVEKKTEERRSMRKAMATIHYRSPKNNQKRRKKGI
ncbi:ribosomal biogenesis factor isoform X2 [Peromyscus californicus insignis]|nr:ribosomal biogenesis factor isoform X2 [Peromyscus californicus insignis]XP_052574369.1 ribosomal biogenesis factor isoform X2 [Peromyscus californicus insignis]XP_052574370.1 ribosomal biogenesis factor isoform X2 [Peromyscus californicus insignis]XP_052574371.1 ribosomal biogenesis factor isoform X2 [Peromyscus californicus insignis]